MVGLHRDDRWEKRELQQDRYGEGSGHRVPTSVMTFNNDLKVVRIAPRAVYFMNKVKAFMQELQSSGAESYKAALHEEVVVESSDGEGCALCHRSPRGSGKRLRRDPRREPPLSGRPLRCLQKQSQGRHGVLGIRRARPAESCPFDKEHFHHQRVDRSDREGEAQEALSEKGRLAEGKAWVTGKGEA